MKTLAISVKKRETVGKKNTRALRNQGNVPCVLYGGEKQVCFYAHENEFRKLSSGQYFYSINISGGKTLSKSFIVR